MTAKRRQFSVSLMMIVRDEEPNIARCLKSVEGLFDEIIVVDTGSNDLTRTVSRSRASKVVDFLWEDNFSAARNEAIYQCTCDYVFWLDADELVDAENRRRITSLLNALDDRETVYFVTQSSRFYRIEKPSYSHSARLFPNSRELRWERRVYEKILPSIQKTGLRLSSTNIAILHYGFTDPKIEASKLLRNRRLVELEITDDPNDLLAFFNLAMTSFKLFLLNPSPEYFQATENSFKKLLKISSPEEISSVEANPSPFFIPDSFRLLSCLYYNKLMHEDAFNICIHGLRIYPNDMGLQLLEAFYRKELGDTKKLENFWRNLPPLCRDNIQDGPRLREFLISADAKFDFANDLEDHNNHYEAFKIWKELLFNHIYIDESSLGCRRAAHRILADLFLNPAGFLRNIKKLFER